MRAPRQAEVSPLALGSFAGGVVHVDSGSFKMVVVVHKNVLGDVQ